MDDTVLPANNTMPAFPSWRSPDVTTTATEAADIQLQLTGDLTALFQALSAGGPSQELNPLGPSSVALQSFRPRRFVDSHNVVDECSRVGVFTHATPRDIFVALQ